MAERASRNLTFPQLLAFVAVALPVVFALRFSISTIDLGYLIRAGEITLDQGAVLRTDTFTFTVTGQPWLNQQWAAGVLFALGFRTGGWELLALLRAALVGGTFTFVYLGCRASGASPRAAGWLTIVAFLVEQGGHPLRAQLLGMFLLALTLWIVVSRHRRPRLLWAIPAIVVVWANVHGSFLLGPAIVTLAWLEDVVGKVPRARRTLAVAIACLLATLVNPFGVRVYSYVAALSTNPVIRERVGEWRPVSLTSLLGIGFVLSALAATVIVIRGRRRLTWPRVLGLLMFFFLAVMATRAVFLWAVAAPILVADLLPAGRPARADGSRAINSAIAGVLVVLGIALLPWFRPLYAVDANSASATDGILAHAPQRFTTLVEEFEPPGARVFVAQIWASWFEVEIPRYPVYADSRLELFASEIWDDYSVVSRGLDGWREILDRWDVDVLALSWEQQAGLIRHLRTAEDPDWRVVASDSNGLLAVRNDSGVSVP